MKDGVLLKMWPEKVVEIECVTLKLDLSGSSDGIGVR